MTDESQEYESGWPVLRAVHIGHSGLHFMAVTDGVRCSVHAMSDLIVVGSIRWLIGLPPHPGVVEEEDEGTGVIGYIHVAVGRRRQGVATALLEVAEANAERYDLPAPRHSDERSPAGEAWATPSAPRRRRWFVPWTRHPRRDRDQSAAASPRAREEFPTMTEHDRSELRRFLECNGPGRIPQVAELARILAPAWPDLSGSDGEAMGSWKLNRMEDPVWQPPVLSFRLERHGAIVAGGATRAEVQTWMADLDVSEARLGGSTRRQVRPAAPLLDVAPLVADVVRAVVAGSEDPPLKWSPDRSVVTIRVGEIIPVAGFAQTIVGRRRRFRELALELDDVVRVVGLADNLKRCVGLSATESL